MRFSSFCEAILSSWPDRWEVSSAHAGARMKTIQERVFSAKNRKETWVLFITTLLSITWPVHLTWYIIAWIAFLSDCQIEKSRAITLDCIQVVARCRHGQSLTRSRALPQNLLATRPSSGEVRLYGDLQTLVKNLYQRALTSFFR